jgi:hypothetical protein
MASAELRPAARIDWAPANPWWWMLASLAITLTAFLRARLLPDENTPLHFLLLMLGLLPAGAAIWIRLGSSAPAVLESFPSRRRLLLLLALAAIGGAMAISTTCLLLVDVVARASLSGLSGIASGLGVGTAPEPVLPWSQASLIWMWVLAAPWGAWLLLTFFRRARGIGSVSRAEESAALLTLAGLSAFASSWALYFGPGREEEWDSIRMAFAVLALVALAAALLVMLPRRLRQAVLSVLLVLHFAGITTAVMAAPPSPWLALQSWCQFYRPYLEFMYLGNAYHFYAPDPGPATYLWFRIESEDSQHQVHSHWLKVPDMDDNTGAPRYPLALEYQRMIALTEKVTHNIPTPPILVTLPDGQKHWSSYIVERFKHSDLALAGDPDILGKVMKEPTLIIPFHPEIPPLSQYQVPDLSSKRFLESFTRHVMHRAAADDPTRTPLRVKAYRVTHLIPSPQTITAGWDPCYPTLFLPYYMGEFDSEGKMTARSREDPLLYWMVPMWKKGESPHAEIHAYVFKHAGEPGWIIDTSAAGVKTKLKLPEDCVIAAGTSRDLDGRHENKAKLPEKR